MEDKYLGIVCKYSSRYIVLCRKFLLNNYFNQIPRNVGPNQFNLAIMSSYAKFISQYEKQLSWQKTLQLCG